ncbi:MAG: matrixin family metalloprotease [Bacteriovoracia bacterium]
MCLRYAVFIFLLCLLPISGAHSYEFTNDFNNGKFWPSFPITLKVLAANEQEKQFTQNALVDAIDEWETAVGGVVKDIWQLDEKSINVVRWSDNFSYETGYDNLSTLGVAVRHSEGPFYVKTEIVLNASNAQLKSNPELLYKVILHELGHVIGLGHSHNSWSIMYDSVGHQDALSEDDIYGAIEVLELNVQRSKETPYRAAQLKQTAPQMVGCGTLAITSDGSDDPPPPSWPSLLLGFFFIQLFMFKHSFRFIGKFCRQVRVIGHY